MKKSLLLSLTCVLPILLSSCSSENPSELVKSGEGKTVKIAIATTPQFDSVARSAYVTVSASDMKDEILEKMIIENHYLYGEVRQIPYGIDRIFEIFVEDHSGKVCYYGKAVADIISGDTTNVTIILRKSGGTAQVIGIIDEGTEPEIISAPAIPWVEIIDSTCSNTAMFHTKGSASSIGDAVVYQFALYEIINPDTGWDPFIDTIRGEKVLVDTTWCEGNWEYKFSHNGTYLVTAQAICPTHMLMSDVSYSSQFNMNVCDNPDTVEVISQPSEPIILYSMQRGSRLYVTFATEGATSSKNHPIEYRYVFFTPDSDTIVSNWSNNTSKEQGFYSDGNYSVFVIARCTTDTMFENYSNSFAFSIRNGIIASSSIPRDTTPPVLTLEYDTIMSFVNDTLPGFGSYSAFDNVHGDITSRVVVQINVDISVPGTYYNVYTVSDLSGNTTSVRQVVVIRANEVIDTIMPINRQESDTVNVETISNWFVK